MSCELRVVEIRAAKGFHSLKSCEWKHMEAE